MCFKCTSKKFTRAVHYALKCIKYYVLFSTKMFSSLAKVSHIPIRIHFIKNVHFQNIKTKFNFKKTKQKNAHDQPALNKQTLVIAISGTSGRDQKYIQTALTNQLTHKIGELKSKNTDLHPQKTYPPSPLPLFPKPTLSGLGRQSYAAGRLSKRALYFYIIVKCASYVTMTMTMTMT